MAPEPQSHRKRPNREPRWKQIEADLLREIRNGRFTGLARLPSEFQLAAQFCVNRHTVRHAIAGLVDCGILAKRKGAGSYFMPGIVDPMPKRYRLSLRKDFAIETGFSCSYVGFSIEPAGEIAPILGLQDGEDTVNVTAMIAYDSVPFSTREIVVQAKRFPGFAEIYQSTNSILESLAAFGVAGLCRQMIKCLAEMPTPNDRHQFRQITPAPILVLETIYVDQLGHAIAYLKERITADRVEISIGRQDQKSP